MIRNPLEKRLFRMHEVCCNLKNIVFQKRLVRFNDISAYINAFDAIRNHVSGKFLNGRHFCFFHTGNCKKGRKLRGQGQKSGMMSAPL